MSTADLQNVHEFYSPGSSAATPGGVETRILTNQTASAAHTVAAVQ